MSPKKTAWTKAGAEVKDTWTAVPQVNPVTRAPPEWTQVPPSQTAAAAPAVSRSLNPVADEVLQRSANPPKLSEGVRVPGIGALGIGYAVGHPGIAAIPVALKVAANYGARLSDRAVANILKQPAAEQLLVELAAPGIKAARGFEITRLLTSMAGDAEIQ